MRGFGGMTRDSLLPHSLVGKESTIMEILCAVINFVVVLGFLGTLIWLALIAIGAVLEGLERLAYKLWG